MVFFRVSTLLSIVVFLAFVPCKTRAQTSSAGEVSIIESLVNEILGINKQIEDVKKRLKANEDKVAEIRKQILAIPGEVAAIEAEKQQMISDCRKGYYCSKCSKSKSEFERRGESFYGHLSDVGAVAVAMPEEKIKEKEQEFDRRIEAVKAKLPGLQASKVAEEDKWVFIKQEQLDLEDKLPALKQKISEHCRQWKDAREKEYEEAYTNWINLLLSSITESITNKCQTDKMKKKHAEFLNNADRLIWNLGIDYENTIDKKINKTSQALYTQEDETRRLRNQKIADLAQIITLIEKRENDSVQLMKDFQYLNPKTGKDSFDFKSSIRNIAFEIQSKRVEYNRVRLNWDSNQIKESVKKEVKLQDSINIMRNERFSRVLAFKNRLQTRKSKGDSLFIKAIAAIKKQVTRIELEIEQAKSATMSAVSLFNNETVKQQHKISGLLSKIGLFNNYGVVKYQEWSVVDNIKSSLVDAATSAISSGTPYSPIISDKIDNVFDRTSWSSKIIAACNEDKTSGFDTMKDEALNNRIKTLEDRFK
jgi:hypothetical protein